MMMITKYYLVTGYIENNLPGNLSYHVKHDIQAASVLFYFRKVFTLYFVINPTSFYLTVKFRFQGSISMTKVYSKLNNPSDLTSGGISQTFMIKNADVDFIDKIKVAINKLKNINQKPRKTKAAKFTCSVCDKNCQEAIFCTHCDHWVHRKCNATSKQEYSRLSNEPGDAPFQCLLCNMKESSQIFPFFFLDKSNLLDLNGIKIIRILRL